MKKITRLDNIQHARFGDLIVGSHFSYNGVLYKKIPVALHGDGNAMREDNFTNKPEIFGVNTLVDKVKLTITWGVATI